jgi:hypothetical protein
VSKWPFQVGDLIGDSQITLRVERLREDTGDFVAQVEKVVDSNKDHGHFGSYVVESRYYQFRLLHDNLTYPDPELLWEIPEEGTDRFHVEGSTGAQFLLYWFKSSGFSFDLDS